MAAEEADVDIEGDIVPAAAQSGWAIETGLAQDEEGHGREEVPSKARGSGKGRGSGKPAAGPGSPAGLRRASPIPSVGSSWTQRAGTVD